MFFVDLLQPCASEAMGAGITAELSFEGNPPGSFRLTLDSVAARSAAADFLGADPGELSSAHLADVVCELANMICGSLLSRIESSTTFRLSKPCLASAEDHSQTGEVACFRARVGAGNLHAEIFLERPVCPEIVESAF